MNTFNEEDLMSMCIDADTGEFDEAMFEGLKIERDRKIENIALWVLEDEAMAKNIKEQENKLKARRETLLQRIEKRKEFLRYIAEGKKLKTDRVTVSYKTSKAVKITNEEIIPAKYKTVKTSVSVSKYDIKKDLQAGKTVEGAELETRISTLVK